MQQTLNDIYSQFTHKAAQGRKMDYDKLEKLARGRVYTGAMATKLGLVDELGTLDDAVKYAAKVAGMSRDEKIERWILPPATSPLESIFGSNDSDAESSVRLTKALAQTLGQLSPELAEKLLRRVDFRAAGPRAAADRDAVPAPGTLVNCFFTPLKWNL